MYVVDPLLPHLAERGFPSQRIARCSCVNHLSWLFLRADSRTTVRHDRIGDLKASSSPCSPEEWERILKALLLGSEPVEGIEAGAEANAGKSIIITIRRRVAGINVRDL